MSKSQSYIKNITNIEFLKKSLLVFMTATMLFVSNAHAETTNIDLNPDDTKDHYVYVFGQAGHAQHTEIDGCFFGGCTDHVGVRAGAGYQFTKNIAVEAAYDLLANTSAVETTTISGHDYVAPYHLNIQGGDAALKLILPVEHRVQLYGKGGVGILHAKLLDTDWTGVLRRPEINSTKAYPEVGAGANLFITKHVGVNVAYTRYLNTGELGPLALASGGLIARF